MRIEIVHQRDLEVAGLSTVEGQSRPLVEIRGLYLTDLATRSCPRHVVNVTASLDRVLADIPAKRVRDVKPYDLISYRAARLKAGISVRSANLGCDVLRSMLRWAERAGLIAQSPIERMPRLPETEATKRYRRRAMTEEEIARFLAAAKADDRQNECAARGWSRAKGALRALGAPRPRVPQAPLFRFLLEAATRYGETVRVTWADLDLDACTVTLRAETTKAGRTRGIPICGDLARELGGLREVHEGVLGREVGQRDRVFRTPDGAAWCGPTNNIMRIFDRMLVAAGIARVDDQGRKLDIHSLRHTAASRYASRGVGLVHLQHLLGHRDPKLTAQVYTHLGVEELRDALEKSAPSGREVRRDAS
ncbi:MAG: tyrosine-type recombinase/integrase [Planctomycetota bacterium]